MCLAVPAKVLEIDGASALVDVAGARRRANVEMVEGLGVGDYVLLHAGFGIQKVDEQEARETIRILEEIDEAGR